MPEPVRKAVASPGPGDPLAPAVAARLEGGLGVDPSPVRVHTGSLAASAAAELGVRAFTWGVDVFLAEGERPADVPLVAHEVTHAIQQAGGPAIHLFDGPHGELEHEAHRTAATVARGGRAVVRGRTSGPKVQGQLGGLVSRAAGAVGGALSSAAGVVAGAVTDVAAGARDRALAYIRDKARSIPGYDLLGFVLGQDPITRQPITRTAENLVKGVLALVPGGPALFENLQQAKVIQRAHDWFTAEIAKLNITWATIGGLFSQAWQALSASDLLDPSGAWEKLRDIFGPPLGRLATFALAAGRKVLEFIFEGALALAGSAGQQVLATFRRAGTVFSLIVADPLKFLTNLLNAVKGGFSQFWSNIGAHLRTGVFEWLMGAMQGIAQLPSVWDFGGILSLILQILGLTYSALRATLVKLIGEPAVAFIEQAFEFVRLIVTRGLSAAWEKIKEFAAGLADQVINAIRDWIARSVVGAAVTKLLTMFNPVGAVIQGIITIYNTIMFFIERAQQIARLVNSILDSIENIAKGATTTAASFVEKTLANTLPVIIGFLARLVGLGSVTSYIRDIIGKIRATIADALEKLGLWIKDRIQGLLRGRTAGPARDPATISDIRDRAGLLVAQRARDKTHEADIDTVVAEVRSELRPQGLTRLEFEPPTPDGDSFLVAEASEPKREGKKTAPKVPERTCVLRATLRFETEAMAAIERGRAVRGEEPLRFYQYMLPRARQGEMEGPTGLQTATPIGAPPSSQERFGAFLVAPPGGSTEAQVVSYNSGSPARTANESHAEAFFMSWFRHARLPGLKELVIDINLSPCTHCARILSEISPEQAHVRRLNYSIAYEGYDRNILKDNTTTQEDLAQLEGWVVTPPIGPNSPRWTDATKREEIRLGSIRYTESHS